MVRKKLLTIALTTVLAMSMAGCGSVLHRAAGASNKSLFERPDMSDSEETRKEKDDEKEDEDEKEEEKEDEKEEEKEDEKEEKEDEKDKEDEDEDDKDDKEDDEDSDKKDDDEDSDLSNLSSKEIKKELKDDLSSGKFAIDDDIYQLPAKVSDFEKNGWEIDEKNTDTYIDSDRSGHVVLENGKESLYLLVENFDDYTIESKDAVVTGVDAEIDFNADMILPCGIEFKTETDDVEDALKDADVKYDYDKEYTKFYGMFSVSADNLYYFIGTSNEKDRVEMIQMQVNVEDKEDYMGADEAEVEALGADDLDIDYDAPDKLKDYKDFELDGKLYTIGAPVLEFLNDGWEIEEGVNSDMQLDAGDIGSVILVKDDSRLQVFVENDQKDTVSIEAATMYRIKASDVDYKFANGIKDGMDLSEVKDILDDEGLDYTTGEVTTYISYSEDNCLISITFDSKDRVSGFALD